MVTNSAAITIINGWRFNFAEMCAERVDYRSGCRNYITLIYLEDKRCITSSALDLKGVQSETIPNYGHVDYGHWFSFFTPPEHEYNKMIDDAYHTYLLERAMISGG